MSDDRFWETLLAAAFEGKDLDPPVVDRDKLQVLVISTKQGVIETIRNLHRRGFAEVTAWSPLLPGPNPDEVMSILTRYLRRS